MQLGFKLVIVALFAGLTLTLSPIAAQDSEILPSISTDSIVIAGRIVSTLEPISATDQSTNNMTTMPQMNEAKTFSMAQDVTWLLSGDWALTANENGENIAFEAEFIKTTTDGMMLHTHKITNFTSAEKLSTATLQGNTTVTGISDIYFNDKLAWKQAATNLTLVNGTVLAIELSEVDDHFHGQPIYGVVDSFTKDGTVIRMPETDISEQLEEELAGLEANATEAGQSIANETSQAARTFAEEANDVIGNITQSVRDLFN